LFERKNALVELCRGLAESGTLTSSPLYEKIVADLGTVTTRLNRWWSEMSAKYQWESVPGCQWEIDFNDASIYLTGRV
jgi:CXXX repeat modification system protein